MDGLFDICAFDAIQTLAFVVITGLWGWARGDARRHNKKMEARAAIRAEESRLSMKMMAASSSLACATAIAVRDKKVNGEMDAGLREAEAAKSEYFAFINRVAASQMTGD